MSNGASSRHKTFSFFLILFGCVLLAFSFVSYRKTSSFIVTAVKADGVVADLKQEKSLNHSHDQMGDSSPMYTSTYYPVVRFAGKNGVTIEFAGKSGSNPPSYTVGEKVVVLYDPSNINNAMINSFESLWLESLLLGAFGLIALFVGVGVFRSGSLKAGKSIIQESEQDTSKNRFSPH